MQYPPPAPSFLTYVVSISLHCLHVCSAIVFVSDVVLFSAPVTSLISPSPSLFFFPWSASPTPAVPWDPAAYYPAQRTPYPGPGRRY